MIKKTEEMPPPIDCKQSKERARYTFTIEERCELGLDACRAQDEANALDREISSIKKGFAAKIEAAETRRNIAMSKQRDGFEMREYQAITVFNEPKKGHKTIYFMDTDMPNKIGALMRQEVMSDSDCQMVMRLEVEREELKGNPVPIPNTIGHALKKVAEDINAGAMDKDGVKVTALVS